MNQQASTGREKKVKKKRDQDSTIQTLYQYGTASSTVLLGTMLVRAARRARSRLHMGQEEILGVFNHVFCSRKKKKSSVFDFHILGEGMTSRWTHAETVFVIHVFTRGNGNYCGVLVLSRG